MKSGCRIHNLCVGLRFLLLSKGSPSRPCAFHTRALCGPRLALLLRTHSSSLALTPCRCRGYTSTTCSRPCSRRTRTSPARYAPVPESACRELQCCERSYSDWGLLRDDFLSGTMLSGGYEVINPPSPPFFFLSLAYPAEARNEREDGSPRARPYDTEGDQRDVSAMMVRCAPSGVR